MKLYRSIKSASFIRELAERRGNGHKIGVTLGNFDAVHFGHQELFRTLRANLHSSVGAPSNLQTLIAVTFFPHPRSYFNRLHHRHDDYRGVDSVRSKFEKISNFEIDFMLPLRFCRELVSLEPEKFVEQVLVEALRADLVVVGHDWTFGRGRAGTTETLTALGKKYGFPVVVVPPFLVDGERVSTGMVRDSVVRGDLARYQNLTGERYLLSGRVRKGRQVGGTILGYPTANLRFRKRQLLKRGVYAGYAELYNKRFRAAINIGVAPTFGETEETVEVHLIDSVEFLRAELEMPEVNLHGERLKVEFVSRIRDEKKFQGIHELKAAIADDIKQCQLALAL